MAVFNVSITVPDAKVAELQAALRERYSTGEVQGARLTNEQLKQRFDEEVRQMLRNIYAEYKKRQATTPDLGVTG